MIIQKEIYLKPHLRGVHLISNELFRQLPDLPDKGLVHLFITHTSAGITINENADPSVRRDLESFLDYLIPENWQGFTHTMEGSDDMPAHIKSTIFGSSVTIPVSGHKLNMGIWQGIYLGEFRNNASGRKIIATIYS